MHLYLMLLCNLSKMEEKLLLLLSYYCSAIEMKAKRLLAMTWGCGRKEADLLFRAEEHIK